MKLLKTFIGTIALSGLALAAQAQTAANYPNKPIRMIVPFSAAGTTDILARAIGQELTKAWGQPVVVENRPGAGGNTGADVVAKAPADGYTLLMGAVSPMAINVTLYYPKLPYDVVKDFAPVTLVATVPNLLVVHPSVPVTTVKELIALAKAKPGQLTFASSGNGTSIHLSGELFKSMAGVDMLHIPYKGSGPAITDLIGGQVNMMFDNMPSVLAQVKGGKLRAIAVTTRERSPALPEVPTIAESGLPGFDASSWFGIFAPAGTPKDIVAKLSAAVAKSLHTTEMKERLAGQGAVAVGNTPEQYSEFVKAEIAKWAKVVKASGAKID